MGRAAVTVRPALARLIALPTETFAERYWGEAAIRTPAAELGRDYGDLFSAAAADELLSQRGLRTPFVRVVKEGSIVDPSRFTRSGGAGAMVADQVVDDRVLDLFAGGHTVVLQGLHRLWPPLIEFAGDLTAELGHPVQINAYVTPKASQGFSAHYDVHDVFVLQIAGRKRWLVHEPVFRHPLRTQPWTQHREAVLARAAEAPSSDDVLEPGDSLYLPRGYVHSAEALGETCIHLTVGIQPYTRHTLVEAIAELLSDDVFLRGSLPLGLGAGDGGDLTSATAATVDAMVGRLRDLEADDLDPILERNSRASARPAPLAPLALADALERLGLDTVLLPREHLRASIDDRGEMTRVELPGHVVTLPPELSPALHELVEGRRPVALASIVGLDEPEVLEAARCLIRAGVALPAAEPLPDRQ